MDNKEITLSVRKALPEDLKDGPATLKYGQVYMLKSMHTGEFDEAIYVINHMTDPFDIKKWIEMDMIFIPVSFLEKARTR